MSETCKDCKFLIKKFAYNYFGYKVYECRCYLTNEFLYDTVLEDASIFSSSLHTKRSDKCEIDKNEDYIMDLLNRKSLLEKSTPLYDYNGNKIMSVPCETIINEKTEVIPNGWIPVEERLPKRGQKVLICTKDLITIDSLEQQGWRVYRDEVLAWMELPEPYKRKR